MLVINDLQNHYINELIYNMLRCTPGGKFYFRRGFFDFTLLDKWKVAVHQMGMAKLDATQRIGFVQIKAIEESLEKKAEAFGVQKLHAEFQKLKGDVAKVVLSAPNKQVELAYDFVITADGAHSLLREELGIVCNRLV